VAFHASNGLVTFLGAMVLMPMLVGSLGLHYLVGNAITVCFTGLLNFFLGDRLVFRTSPGSA
jgi:putative flippase GtrA